MYIFDKVLDNEVKDWMFPMINKDLKILQYRCNNSELGKKCIKRWQIDGNIWECQCSNNLNPQKCLIHIKLDMIEDIRKDPKLWAVQHLQSEQQGLQTIAALIVKDEIKI